MLHEKWQSLIQAAGTTGSVAGEVLAPSSINGAKAEQDDVLGVDSGGRLESKCSELGRRRSTGNWGRVTGRTWLQLMCCAHLYD